MSAGAEQARVTLEAWLVTDVGVVRDHNEDSAFMEPGKGFFIVADGMGGHAAGEVASEMAVETVRKTLEAAKAEIDAFKKGPSDAGRRAIVQLLQSAVLSAHQAVFQRGQTEQDKAGMGTTLDVVLVAGPEAFVAHVGDSRTYLIREGRSSQITTDHTVAEVLVIEGKLTIEEAQVSPLRTILVNAIGVSADVGVEMAHVTLKRGDRLLLCSDGLHDYFPIEEEIAQKMSSETPGDALKDMVELAKTRGGHDNITGVAVHVAEIVEGVPAQIEGESTQPVDTALNPFASDEPTETAFLAPTSGMPAKGTVTLPSTQVDVTTMKATQPMRAIEPDKDDGLPHADTIPPPDNKKQIERLPTDPPADKPESKKKKKKKKKAEQKAANDGDAKDKDKDKDKDDDDEGEADGTPTEIATADTGRIVKKDSDSKDSDA
jgi:serine/threonine protein phosphatase PrpC